MSSSGGRALSSISINLSPQSAATHRLSSSPPPQLVASSSDFPPDTPTTDISTVLLEQANESKLAPSDSR